MTQNPNQTDLIYDSKSHEQDMRFVQMSYEPLSVRDPAAVWVCEEDV